MPEMSVVTKSPIEEDEFGRVAVRFGSAEILKAFIEMLNMNKVRGPRGDLLTFEVEAIKPGWAYVLTISSFPYPP